MARTQYDLEDFVDNFVPEGWRAGHSIQTVCPPFRITEEEFRKIVDNNEYPKEYNKPPWIWAIEEWMKKEGLCQKK